MENVCAGKLTGFLEWDNPDGEMDATVVMFGDGSKTIGVIMAGEAM